MNRAKGGFSQIKRGIGRFLFTEDHKFSLPETRWAARITSISPYATNSIIVLGSLIGGGFLGHKLWSWGVLCGLAIAIGVFLDSQRDTRENRIANEKRELEIQAVRDLVRILIDTSQGTCDALSIEEKRKRQESLAAARRAILSTIRRSIGPSNGLRVNFFEVSESDPPTLKASAYGHEGRDNHRSTRTFTLNDESFNLAFKHNQGRFIEDAQAAGLDDPLPYQTFATMPVSSEDYLYGMITVDSPDAGDIDVFEAKELLNLYASQFALTFMSDQKDTKKLRIGDIDNDSDK